MTDTHTREIVLNGISASPGICIGKAYLVDREGVDVVGKYSIERAHIRDEVTRFKAAVKNAKDELEAIMENTPEDLQQHAYIFETHQVLLKDKMLYGKIIETIEQEQVNAEWAVKKVVSELRAMFQNMSDDYLRERASDIVQISDRIMKYLTGAKSVNIGKIDKRVILVAHDLSPAETSQIQLERVKGFVTDRGGKASHTGIIAQTLEIPAVVGLDHATAAIRNEDLIIVDGTSGVVIVRPTEATLLEYEEKRIRYQRYRSVITREGKAEAETLDGVRVQVLGNIELPEEVVSVINYGGDGVGLYRTEFQYLSRSAFPTEFDLFDKYRDVVEVMAPRPVTIRTLDINGDKAVAYASPDREEKNPALGLRAIRYCLKKPGIFKVQLRAILRAAAHGHVRVLFPMICSYEELLAAKELLAEAADSLEAEGLDYKRRIETGILVEVPSAVIMADAMAEEVDFFSIGTNDLIQYSLAIDRGNRHVAHLYDPLNPAILRMLKHVTDVAREKGIKVFMCGEMAADPICVPILLGLGVQELSMHPQAIPTAKRMIRSIRAAEAMRVTEEALKLKRAADIHDLVKEAFGDMLKDMFSG